MMPAAAMAQETAGHQPRWTLDMLAAGRKVSGDVLGEHIWGGGGAVALEYRPAMLLGVTIGAVGVSTPQLNFRDQAKLNEVSPSLGLVWHAGRPGGWEPYAITGITRQRFTVDEPPTGIASRSSYLAATVAAGMSRVMTHRLAWKTELSAQPGSRGTSYGMATGLTIRMAAPQARRVQRPAFVSVHDTVVVRDTVVLTRQHLVTDTLIVHDTVAVDRPRDITRVVRGEDIILTLKDANFDFAQSQLRPEAFPILDALATQLASAQRALRILVVGHTDDIGTDDANARLGGARAQAVRDYLVHRGIAADRIETSSDGESRPIATNRTAAGRQLNRRVVISRIP